MRDYRIILIDNSQAQRNTEVIAIPVLCGPSGPKLLDDSPYSDYEPFFSALGISGGKDELVRIPAAGATADDAVLAFAGLGKEANADTLRQAAGSVTRQLKKFRTITLDFAPANEQQLRAIIEGACLGTYRFNAYRGKKEEAPAEIRIVSSLSLSEAQIEDIAVTADAVALAKDLVNTPGRDLYPAKFADTAVEAFRDLNDVQVTVWDENQLEQLGCGALGGVGRGSAYPPRLVKIAYTPAQHRTHLALVGKGITFDTGGLSLKSSAGMLGMKYDMTGSASVMAIVQAVARLRLPVRVTGWLCLAENMLSRSATRPGDVLTAYNGKTIEVTNTDAEGRLVLADGLSMAGEEQPDMIVDIATLTGAARAALGEVYSGLMANDADFAQAIKAAAAAAGEKFCLIPIDDEQLYSALKSDIADMINSSAGKVPGMQFAAAFLKEFETLNEAGEPIAWAHLDIAGTANAGSDSGFNSSGPTGVTIRALVEFSRRLTSA